MEIHSSIKLRKTNLFILEIFTILILHSGLLVIVYRASIAALVNEAAFAENLYYKIYKLIISQIKKINRENIIYHTFFCVKTII